MYTANYITCSPMKALKELAAECKDTTKVRVRGGSKSMNHTSMHRVKHEEMNESSAHGDQGTVYHSPRVLSHMRPVG